jgi:anti-repressor protein
LGYAKKQNAKNKLLNNFEQNIDYTLTHVRVNSTQQGFKGGRPSEDIRLTIDCFKSLGMMAGTEQGKEIRKYFLNCERVVKEVIPAQVDRIRELELQITLSQAETQKALAEKSVLDTRHLIVTTCPEPVQQKILGYKEVVTVEYRDRQFEGDRLINDGTTVTKTELCDRYGLKTRNGKPDYKKLNALLKETGISELSDAWQLAASIQESQQFRRKYLPTLDRLVDDSSRQMWLGE